MNCVQCRQAFRCAIAITKIYREAARGRTHTGIETGERRWTTAGIIIVDAKSYAAAIRRGATEIDMFWYTNFIGGYSTAIGTECNSFITTQLGCVIVGAGSTAYGRIDSADSNGFKIPLYSRCTSNGKFQLGKRYAETAQVTIGHHAWRGNNIPVAVGVNSN